MMPAYGQPAHFVGGDAGEVHYQAQRLRITGYQTHINDFGRLEVRRAGRIVATFPVSDGFVFDADVSGLIQSTKQDRLVTDRPNECRVRAAR